MSAIVSALLTIFGIMLLGMITQRRRLFPESMALCLNQFVYWVSLPCLLFSQMCTIPGSDNARALVWGGLAASMLCYLLFYALFSRGFRDNSRAATIRNIQNRDIDLLAKQVRFRHTKSGKIQIIPLCNLMANILRDYLSVRQGEPTDYLFCNLYGEMLTENALRLAIAKYNRKRGVYKTSVHLFRHTFARKYLIDCGGDAFTLQRLLGHSTLNMTKHYCAIFDTDITENYDNFSPLAHISKPKDRIRR